MRHFLLKNSPRLAFSTCLLLSAVQVVSAAPTSNATEVPQPIAKVVTSNTIFTLEAEDSNGIRGITQGNTELSITGPRGYLATSKGTTTVDLRDYGELDDGLYRYEVTSSTRQSIKLRKNRMDNGRGNKERNTVQQGATQSGHFRIKNGSIVTEANISEEKK